MSGFFNFTANPWDTLHKANRWGHEQMRPVSQGLFGTDYGLVGQNESWDAYNKRIGGAGSQFWSPDFYMKSMGLRSAPNAEQQGQLDAAAKRQADMDRLYAEYMAEMQKPIDENDPVYAGMLQTARNHADSRARLQGIEGGLSNANTTQAGLNAHAQLETQRRQLLAQALPNYVGYGQGRASQMIGDVNQRMQQEWNQKWGPYGGGYRSGY
jgi:hypothetical protein